MFHMRFNSWPWSIFTQSKGHLIYNLMFKIIDDFLNLLSSTNVSVVAAEEDDPRKGTPSLPLVQHRWTRMQWYWSSNNNVLFISQLRLCDFCFRNNMWYAVVLNCTLSHLCVCLRIKFFSVFVNKNVFVSSYTLTGLLFHSDIFNWSLF